MVNILKNKKNELIQRDAWGDNPRLLTKFQLSQMSFQFLLFFTLKH